MQRFHSLDETLLKGFEYPVSLVVEVTKQGVSLSKLRYLKNLGQVVNETIRSPVIEVYMHMGNFIDPYLVGGKGRPIGIDWIFKFDLDKELYRETINNLQNNAAKLNIHNPKVSQIATYLMKKIMKGKTNFKRFDDIEKGLVVEPYCNLAFQKAGAERKVVLQNVQIMESEASIRVMNNDYEDIYISNPGPQMEIDLLVITEISNVHSILGDLERMGFRHTSVLE